VIKELTTANNGSLNLSTDKNGSFLEFSQKALSTADARSSMAFLTVFFKLSDDDLCALEVSAIGASTTESFRVDTTTSVRSAVALCAVELSADDIRFSKLEVRVDKHVKYSWTYEACHSGLSVGLTGDIEA
jgi:hypothetical protein